MPLMYPARCVRIGNRYGDALLLDVAHPLFFVPLANKDWSDEDPRKIVLYGPDGAILQTEDGSSSVTVAPEEIRLKSKAVYLEAEDIFMNGQIHLNGPIVRGQSPDEGYNRFADWPSQSREGCSYQRRERQLSHSHDVTGVQSGGSTITSKKPNPG
ncbi:hypothetical protein O5624_02275 [Escherichia coli]|nr:hypothetical protein [Escherichia coli]